jgi:hypothetical protein
MTDQEREVLGELRVALDKAIEEIPPESRLLPALIRFDDGIQLTIGGPRRPSACVGGEKLKARRPQQRGDRPSHLRPVGSS